MTSRIKVLKHFNDYLFTGTYPFYKESDRDYHIRLQEVVNQTLESDLPAVENVTFETVQKAKKLLMIISENVPFVPNMTQLCQSLDTTRDSCLKLLYALDRAHVLHLLTTELKSYKKLVNPDKILLGNSNIMYAVGGAGKSSEQIKDEPGNFLAVDETETGYGARIPLWLFGFLY